MNTPFAHLRAILLLPFNVLVVVPALLLWLGSGPWAVAGPAEPRFWLALLCFGAGLSLMVWTIGRFAGEGDGTLAPWDPTEKLVVSGVYRHVRNPMITGVITNLVGEALLFGSASLASWAAIFALGNAIYIPLSEEPGLEKRFGEDYRRYRANVPRWLPRLRPWSP
ncbi:MAG: RemK protein [Deltaproteobacteria bacterium]|jgi:protein-S-isoprenylcysteine O-methyltransferase Ste14|nr:RemK protein [Deltaproteobacteria bacterium]